MKHFFIFLFIITCAVNYAQNLVPNPSFEEYDTCPIYGSIDFSVGWTNPNNYSPEYFNVCANSDTPHLGVPNNGYGNQNARTGAAYAGIYIPVTSENSLREYIQAELTESLIAGAEYSVKFYVSLAENHSDYAVNTIAAYFSVSAISNTTNTVFNVNPQIVNNPIVNPLTDKDNWQEVSGTFVASGGEKFITIGNFQNDGNVDTTSLVQIPSLFDKSYYYIDDVSVERRITNNVNEFSIEHPFKYYPNPVSDILNIEPKNNQNYDIKMLDITGNIIFSYENINNLKSINVNQYSNGIYSLQLSKGNILLSNKKIIVHH